MDTANYEFKGKIKPSYLDSEPWWPELPDLSDKPNVLYILIDDTGFADFGCYGSMIETPNIDALAAEGLQYNNFHVNSMCSPTRASLLSGCNHHSVGMGYIADLDMGFPNLKGQVSHRCGLISEILQEKGYATFCAGKWHLVPPEFTTPAGPFDQWPMGRGFDKFYGFMPADTSQYYPCVVNGNEYVQLPYSPDEGYHLSEDLVSKAISYIGQTKSAAPEKPFFCYLAFGAHHAPHHAPKAYVDRYKGKFDEGWAVCRQRVFDRQKELGIFPEDTVLSACDDLVADWDSCTEEEKKVLAKYMEVWAGFITHTDDQIGRLIAYLKKIGQYENTMIVFMTDNGTSTNGGQWGQKNELQRPFNCCDLPIVSAEEAETLGSPDAACQYPVAWANVGATPFRMYKTWSYSGGVRVPLIISYPDKIKDKGTMRNQYHHVVDINATVLDVLGYEAPKVLKGVPQMDKHGVSMAYTFDKPDAEGERHIQYYELMGNRALWCDGWEIVADHIKTPSFDFNEDKWELFHAETDPSQAIDLAEKYPEKVQELEHLWWQEAGKYGVLPMLESNRKKYKDYTFGKMLKANPALEKTYNCYYPEFDTGYGMDVQGRSYTTRVRLHYRKGDEGVLYSCGDDLAGYALYIEEGRLKMHYNYINQVQFRAESEIELPEGDIVVGVDFVKVRNDFGICHLHLNGDHVGKVEIDRGPLFKEHGHILAIGHFAYAPVCKEYRPKGIWRYTGEIDRVEFRLDTPFDEEGFELRDADALRTE